MTMSKMDVTKAIQPKSDQLNADDLVAGPITVEITGAQVVNRTDQPITLQISGGYQPYKPCKGMARVMATLWGRYADDWVGKSMTLYREPSVKWSGVEVGGIRISHMSDIKNDMVIPVTVSRGKKSPVKICKLVQKNQQTKQSSNQAEQQPLPEYPADKFETNLPAWKKAIESGKMTAEQVIERASATSKLTEQQISEIAAPF